MKRFNFFKYTTLGNKVHTTYFDYWFFKHLTQCEEPVTPAVEGEGTNFTLEPTSNKKLAVVSLKGDTSQNTIAGNNLFNMNTASKNVILVWVSGADYADAGSVVSDYIAATDNEEVRCQYSGAVFFYDSSKTLLGHFDVNGEFITTAGGGYFKAFTIPTNRNIAYIRLAFRAGAAGNPSDLTDKDIMVNKGSTLLPYEPYCGGIPSPNPDYPQDVNVVTGTQTLTITNGTDVQTYPLTLGSLELVKIGTYQDYIYKEDDKWYVHKETVKQIFDGTENWNYGSISTFYRASLTFSGWKSGQQNFYNSHFIAGNTSTTPNVCGIGSSQVFMSMDASLGVTSKTAWLNWLGNNNVTMYVILATATDTEITDATLLADLNDLLDKGKLKKGTNTIQTTATGTNLPTIIYIKTN